MSKTVPLRLSEQLVLDPGAIAERALCAPDRAPDEVIEGALQEVGLGSSYCSSRVFRLAYSACAKAYSRLIAEADETLTAAYLWDAYSRGLSQTDIARVRRMPAGEVKRQSHQLGFILERDFHNKMQFVLSMGPCLVCFDELAVEELDEDHLCEGCR